MATITRARARKPLIAKGTVWSAVRPIWNEDPERPGFNKSDGDGYILAVNDSEDHKTSLELTLSRREMLDVVCSWLNHEQQMATHFEKKNKSTTT